MNINAVVAFVMEFSSSGSTLSGPVPHWADAKLPDHDRHIIGDGDGDVNGNDDEDAYSRPSIPISNGDESA